MFFSSLLILLFIPVALLISVGIPLIIGVVVYRDANKRVDCSPWLWALVAALVPSFVGVVIYLIIRNDYPLKPADSFDDEEQGYYQQNYDNQAVGNKHILPTWAKVILIIVAALLIIWLVGMIIATFSYMFGTCGFGAALY